MKYLAWFTGIIITLVSTVYVVAFTSFGNGLIKPTIEEKIQEVTKLDSKLSKFSLSMSEIDLLLEINTNNTLHVEGTYSLFSSSFDINYNVELNELKTLEPLAKAPITGIFKTDGNIKGDMKFLEVNGKSDLASSKTSYHVELKDMKPTSIIAKIQKLHLDELLKMGGQKAYASADVNLNLNFKSIELHKLDGDVSLSTSGAKINSQVMKKDFAIDIPKTTFAMKLDAKLNGDNVKYNYKLLSNLFQITSSGNVVPEPLKTDIKYAVNIKELALLKPVTGADVRGSFQLNGTLKGTKEEMVVLGKSDVAFSDTSFKAILKNFEPASIKADIKNLRLAQALYMVKQPHYTDGLFSLHVDIPNAKASNLKGIVKSDIKHGVLDSAYMTKAYEFKSKMPRTTYTLNTISKLNGDVVDTKVNLISSLAKLDIKSAKFNIKDSSLKSDYITNIKNLDKLFFVSQQHMRGGLVMHGDLVKAKDLDLTMHTKVASGKIDAKLHNDDLHADLVNVQTLGLLHMLIYPELFKSSLNAKVDYNLATSKGDVDGHLIDGHFVKNQTFDLIKQYAHINMYKETFKGDVSANINKEKILANLDLKSRTSSIKTTNTKLNTKTQQIDSKLLIVANKNPINTHLTGDINQPKVSVDLEAFMKSKAGKKVEKELNRFLKKLF